MILKKGATHLTLNMMARYSDVPGFISYSRGYHDTLSFWYLEHFVWEEKIFRLYNVRHVIVARSNITEVPAYFRTVYPLCPSNESLSRCTTHRGHGFSVHQVRSNYGYFEFASLPLEICSEPGLKSSLLRHFVLNVTSYLWDNGALPTLSPPGQRCRLNHETQEAQMGGSHEMTWGSRILKFGVSSGNWGGNSSAVPWSIATVQIHRDNLRYIDQEALKGPKELQEAVKKFGSYSLQVSNAFQMKGSLLHIHEEIRGLVNKQLSWIKYSRVRRQCQVLSEFFEPNVYKAQIQCPEGITITPADAILLKVSFHPQWSADYRVGTLGAVNPLRVVHTAPNFIGVYIWQMEEPLRRGDLVTVEFRFRTPKDQIVLGILGLLGLGALIRLGFSQPLSPSAPWPHVNSAPKEDQIRLGLGGARGQGTEGLKDQGSDGLGLKDD
mmetsp:Transcript_38666/g.60304  ORF Transcript_38666/g.60304 Transcript_38666/m.60304 type:complete len:438 (-) Transcript_38666:572-1885(-)